MEKETLDLRAIIAILGDRPFPPKSNYKAYLEVKKEDEANVEKEKEKEKEKAETSESAEGTDKKSSSESGSTN